MTLTLNEVSTLARSTAPTGLQFPIPQPRLEILDDMCREFDKHPSDCDYVFAYDRIDGGLVSMGSMENCYLLHGCTRDFADRFGVKTAANLGKISGERQFGVGLRLFCIFKKEGTWTIF